jgi:hypothetical protein
MPEIAKANQMAQGTRDFAPLNRKWRSLFRLAAVCLVISCVTMNTQADNLDPMPPMVPDGEKAAPATSSFAENCLSLGCNFARGFHASWRRPFTLHQSNSMLGDRRQPISNNVCHRTKSATAREAELARVLCYLTHVGETHIGQGGTNTRIS